MINLGEEGYHDKARAAAEAGKAEGEREPGCLVVMVKARGAYTAG